MFNFTVIIFFHYIGKQKLLLKSETMVEYKVILKYINI